MLNVRAIPILLCRAVTILFCCAITLIWCSKKFINKNLYIIKNNNNDMDDKLKTFEDYFNESLIPATEGDAIDDYADSLNSGLTIELQTALSGLFDKYGEDVVVNAINRLYK